MNEFTAPAPIAAAPRGNDKIWSLLSHLSTFLGFGFILIPFVVYLAMRDDSAYVRDNAREALNFHLSVLIYGVLCFPLIFAFGLGVVLYGVLWALLLVCSIIAAFRAADGGCYRYPVTLRLVR